MSVYEYLLCENCGGRLIQTNVSKKSKQLFVKRTRKCEDCGKLYHTLEMPIGVYNKSVATLNQIIQTIKDSQ